MLREFIWRIVAFIVTRPSVRSWLVLRAEKTPYLHIKSADGADVYMGRWWLFNPYGRDEPARWQWLPSIRLHHIRRPDLDRHMHDHPWDARTIVLDGWYQEERPYNPKELGRVRWTADHEPRCVFKRETGYTGRLMFREYHRISAVSVGGVFTLFFTWRKRGEWGFLKDGRKVPWREYLNAEDAS